MKIYILIFLSVTLLNISYSQSQVTYIPLRCVGTPPSHMVKSAIQKNKDRVIRTSPYRRRNERLAEMEFYSSGTYSINELLTSGKVVYGENISAYLEKILKNILEANHIDKDIKIFPVKSSSFNAFATEEPVIFVNLGLLHSVRNESEIAFVICHELAHHLNKHSLEGYLMNYKLENLKEFKSLSSYDVTVKKHGYSREMENEADSIGMIYFNKTEYARESAVTVFELMSNDYEEFKLDSSGSIINFYEYYNSLSQNIIDSLNKIHLFDPIINLELSTHPESNKRKKNIEKWIDSKVGQSFVQQESEFRNIQKTALLESVRLSIIEGNLPQAYFIANSIIQRHEEYSLYAEKQLMKSLLYLMDMKFQNGASKTPKLNDFRLSNNSAYIPILYYYLLKNDQELINEIDRIFTEVLENNNDEELNALNNWYLEKIEEWRVNRKDIKSAMTKKTVSQKQYLTDKKIFIDPYFLSVDFRKVYQLDFVKTEKEQIRVSKKMQKHIKKHNDYGVISIADKSQITSDVLYDREIVTNRISEIINSPINKIPPFPTDYFQVKEICEKYGSQNVSISFAATAYYEDKPGLAAIMTFIFAPIGIAMMTIPTFTTVADYKEIDLISGTTSNSQSTIDNKKFSGLALRKLYFNKF
jgi:Zn-dependent protease with chaperone function